MSMLGPEAKIRGSEKDHVKALFEAGVSSLYPIFYGAEDFVILSHEGEGKGTTIIPVDMLRDRYGRIFSAEGLADGHDRWVAIPDLILVQHTGEALVAMPMDMKSTASVDSSFAPSQPSAINLSYLIAHSRLLFEILDDLRHGSGLPLMVADGAYLSMKPFQMKRHPGLEDMVSSYLARKGATGGLLFDKDALWLDPDTASPVTIDAPHTIEHISRNTYYAELGHIKNLIETKGYFPVAVLGIAGFHQDGVANVQFEYHPLKEVTTSAPDLSDLREELRAIKGMTPSELARYGYSNLLDRYITNLKEAYDRIHLSYDRLQKTLVRTVTKRDGIEDRLRKYQEDKRFAEVEETRLTLFEAYDRQKRKVKRLLEEQERAVGADAGHIARALVEESYGMEQRKKALTNYNKKPIVRRYNALRKGKTTLEKEKNTLTAQIAAYEKELSASGAEMMALLGKLSEKREDAYRRLRYSWYTPEGYQMIEDLREEIVGHLERSIKALERKYRTRRSRDRSLNRRLAEARSGLLFPIAPSPLDAVEPQILYLALDGDDVYKIRVFPVMQVPDISKQ